MILHVFMQSIPSVLGRKKVVLIFFAPIIKTAPCFYVKFDTVVV